MNKPTHIHAATGKRCRVMSQPNAWTSMCDFGDSVNPFCRVDNTELVALADVESTDSLIEKADAAMAAANNPGLALLMQVGRVNQLEADKAALTSALTGLIAWCHDNCDSFADNAPNQLVIDGVIAVQQTGGQLRGI